MLMAATDLLDRNPDPSDDEIRAGISGNLCRCTGYSRSSAAIHAAAEAADIPRDRRRSSSSVNGAAKQLRVDDAELVGDTLRDRLDLKSVRYGCMEGVCGSCTILVDGAPARGCLLLTAQLDGATLVTVEGLEKDGRLSPLQQAVIDHGAFQCGFCISGFLITATSYLEQHPRPSRDEIAEALAGNLCRCTGYVKILDAVEAAAAGSSPGASAPLVP